MAGSGGRKRLIMFSSYASYKSTPRRTNCRRCETDKKPGRRRDRRGRIHMGLLE